MKIMINGRACSGKDAIADYLVETYGFKKISFADPIYKIAREYFNMTTKDRELLQKIGQKFREIDRDVWIKYLLKNIDSQEDWVISDVRQSNEYILCKEQGFIPIRVSANLTCRILRCMGRDGIIPDTKLWENDSETGADTFEYIEVDNNSSKEKLFKQIDDIIKNN